MSLLNLYTADYITDNSNILSKLPSIKVKFRDTFCVPGQKFEYADLSKVAVSNKNNKLLITPYVFTDLNDMNAVEVDYIGIYAIGILELLYLVLKRNDSNIAHFHHNFNQFIGSIFNNYVDVEELMNKIESDEYKKQLNLFYQMRTDYDREGYKCIINRVNELMLIWLHDKRIFWEVFFEIFEFCKPIALVIFEEFIFGEHPNVFIDHSWVNKDFDLHFKRIAYTVPNSENIRYITDCRGVGIFACMSFYYSFVYEFGYDCQKDHHIAANDTKFLAQILANLTNCIGNDNQYKALSGKYLDEPPVLDLRNAHVYNQSKTGVKYRVHDDFYIQKHVWEDLVLFSCANTRPDDKSKFVLSCDDVNMHYSNMYNLVSAISGMLYFGPKLVSTDTKAIDTYKETITELESTKIRLSNELDKAKDTIEELTNNTTANDEVEKLKLELEEAKRIIDSKSNIINQLKDKNKSLNTFISNIFSDDDIEETELDETCSIEDMVLFLNDFKITMVGGRFELLSKLNSYGWTNVDQFDSSNLVSTNKQSDFYVINTAFNSHKVVRKVESMENNNGETIMYFNGTNAEKLIESCYRFVKKFFE